MSETRDRVLSPAEIAAMLARYRVVSGHGVSLTDRACDDVTPETLTKPQAESLLAHGVTRLARLQELLYAQRTWSLLVILQAMDAAGKDSTIKHVMSGVNPQGVSVTSFKAPNADELAHDFLWRIAKALPARGMIGIFNRSHYEDVLATRVHPDLLTHANLPRGVVHHDLFWDKRLEAIAAFERHLEAEGTRIVKIFLHVSPEEQKKRLLARLDDPEKTWKFDAGDLRERAHWADYRRAYETAIGATATAKSPWYVVPADKKWFARLVVMEAVIDALEALDPKAPALSPDQRDDLAKARAALAD